MIPFFLSENNLFFSFQFSLSQTIFLIIFVYKWLLIIVWIVIDKMRIHKPYWQYSCKILIIIVYSYLCDNIPQMNPFLMVVTEKYIWEVITHLE